MGSNTNRTASQENEPPVNGTNAAAAAVATTASNNRANRDNNNEAASPGFENVDTLFIMGMGNSGQLTSDSSREESNEAISSENTNTSSASVSSAARSSSPNNRTLQNSDKSSNSEKSPSTSKEIDIPKSWKNSENTVENCRNNEQRRENHVSISESGFSEESHQSGVGIVVKRKRNMSNGYCSETGSYSFFTACTRLP